MVDFFEEFGVKFGGYLVLLDVVDGCDLKWLNKFRFILLLRGEERVKLKIIYILVIICSYLLFCEIVDVK